MSLLQQDMGDYGLTWAITSDLITETSECDPYVSVE